LCLNEQIPLVWKNLTSTTSCSRTYYTTSFSTHSWCEILVDGIL